MKRLISFFIPALVATLVLASCKPDEPDPVEPTIYTITALTEDGTKAGLQSETYQVVWEQGDSFYAYSSTTGGTSSYTAGSFSIAGGVGTTAASLTSQKAIDPEAVIWSPASLGSAPDRLFWPEVQKYSTSNIVSGIPMFCTSIDTGTDTQTLQFKNLGGLLGFTLRGSAKYQLTSIEVSSSTPLAGLFQIDGDSARLVTSDDAFIVSSIRLDVPSVPLYLGGETFFVSLVPGTYEDVTVKFSFAEQAPVIAKLGSSVTIKRKAVTPFDVTMPDVEKYQAGRLIRVDDEKDLMPQTIINEVMEVAGTTNPLLQMLLGAYVYNPVHLARIVYYTKAPSGALVPASGVVAYQHSETEPLEYDRLVSFQHGTCDIAAAPSYQETIAMELLPACINADPTAPKYYIAAMADYLGYGISQTDDLQHPYMHTALTGGTCADMIAATEEFLASREIVTSSDKLDLIGYSQGGAATLQILLELESRGFDDNRINEVWAGAGPYDLVGFIDFFKSNDNLYGRTGFVPYTFRGICYGENLKIPNTSLYNSELLNRLDVDKLFSTTQLSTWHEALGDDLRAVLHPDFYEDGYNGSADILTLVAALKANSVINKPQPKNVAKIKLYHSETDNTVPYACSTALCDSWPGLGEINHLVIQDNHLMAGIEFMLIYCGLGSLINYL